MIKFEGLFGPGIGKSAAAQIVEFCDQASELTPLHPHRAQLGFVVLRKSTENERQFNKFQKSEQFLSKQQRCNKTRLLRMLGQIEKCLCAGKLFW